MEMPYVWCCSFKAFTDPLAWFLTLGKSDTQQMRDEIEDLLHDTRKSIQTLIELDQILASFDKRKFNEKTFYEVYLHCTYTYTGADAPEQARTHCRDVVRDVRRISFKEAKVPHVEWGQWKEIDKSFAVLVNADQTFLDDFAKSLRQLDKELDAIKNLLMKKRGTKHGTTSPKFVRI